MWSFVYQCFIGYFDNKEKEKKNRYGSYCGLIIWSSYFRDRTSAQIAIERRMNLENMRRREMDIQEEQDGGMEMGDENYSDANMSDASIERGSKVIAGMETHYMLALCLIITNTGWLLLFLLTLSLKQIEVKGTWYS